MNTISAFLPRAAQFAPLTERDETVLAISEWLDKEGYTSAAAVLKAVVTRHEMIALEEVRDNDNLRSNLFARTDLKCRIWNGCYCAYWRPGGYGYTKTALDAGVWTVGNAYFLTSHVGKEKQLAYEILEEGKGYPEKPPSGWKS